MLCCQDWRRTVVLGHLAECSLEEVWWGKPYVEIRKAVEGLIPMESLLCHHCEFAVSGFDFDQISERYGPTPQGMYAQRT